MQNRNIVEDTLLDCIMDDDDNPSSVPQYAPTPSRAKIKHIVCSGGGTFGFIVYGILKQSCHDGFWKIEDIESMYGTSIGAVMCLLISLLRRENGLTWDLLDNYIITRPWQNVFKIDLYTITKTLQNGGILNKESIEQIFTPLFKTLDLPKNMTLKEHYDALGIELHVYSTELDTMETVDISYKTHPDMYVVDAVYASCSLPLLFSPYIQENKTLFDGGLFCNYPLYFCIDHGKNIDEIIGLKWIMGDASNFASAPSSYPLDNEGDSDSESNTSQSVLFDYILSIFRNLTTKIKNYDTCKPIKYQFDIPCPELSFYDIYLAIISSDKRKQMVDDGIAFWKKQSV